MKLDAGAKVRQLHYPLNFGCQMVLASDKQQIAASVSLLDAASSSSGSVKTLSFSAVGGCHANYTNVVSERPRKTPQQMFVGGTPKELGY